jgi:hypothetical protein
MSQHAEIETDVAVEPKGRRKNDAYYTTAACARALVDQLPLGEERLRVLEPSVGGGAFLRAIRRRRPFSWVVGVDIDPAAGGLPGCDDVFVGDFLDRHLVRTSFDWCIGNPPFSRGSGRFNAKGKEIPESVIDLHVDRALELSRNVAFLLRAAAIESDDRKEFWERLQQRCRHVWFLGQRPSFTEGGTDNCMYGFFWWDREWTGPSTWSRLDWK